MTSVSTGIAIALAWPETYCKQPGAWYDRLAGFIGISRHGYYKVGHAAILLIDRHSGNCHYFDFGRYHSPFGKGRVRSKHTDHELTIELKAVFDPDGELSNYEEILELLANKKACHGTGTLHASRIMVNFHAAYSKAIEMQQNAPIPYGPFLRTGTNCSRFVRSVIHSGVTNRIDRFRLISAKFISPTPKSNVRKLYLQQIVQPKESMNPFTPRKMEQSFFRCTLPRPDLHSSVPQNALWLSGEGAGSWFVIEKESSLFRIQRFNENGDLECDCFGSCAIFGFNPQEPFGILHPSDCSRVTITQANVQYQLKLFTVSCLLSPAEENTSWETNHSFLSK